MTYEEVKKYDVGMKPHPRFPQQQKIKVYKPLLSDLLDSVQQYMTTAKEPCLILILKPKPILLRTIFIILHRQNLLKIDESDQGERRLKKV